MFSKNTDDEVFLVCNTTPSAQLDLPKPAGTFCSLVKSFCKTENCKTCKALQYKVPNHVWICTKCASDNKYIMHPFWEIESCEMCGSSAGVMVCAKKRKQRRYPTT